MLPTRKLPATKKFPPYDAAALPATTDPVPMPTVPNVDVFDLNNAEPLTSTTCVGAFVPIPTKPVDVTLNLSFPTVEIATFETTPIFELFGNHIPVLG